MGVTNPLLVNVVELRRSVGNQREFHQEVELDDVALVSARVALGSTLHVDLVLEPVSGGLAVDVAEVFEDRPTEGETYPIDGDTIDLEPMVRELTVLALPVNPLCSDDCAGPVPEAFPVVVESDDDEPPADPRWA